MINVAVMGYGTIGSGVVEILNTNSKIVAGNAESEVRVKKVLDLRDFPGSPVESILTHDFNDIVNDPEIDIVVEVMGGTGAAYRFVKASLEAGKSVVTSNKALVAAYGPELISIAAEKNINFFFEASVGGGIPIIRPLVQCLTAEDILEITGILNGTTNFILTKMFNEGSEFAPTLKEAQSLGYAEADPTADVEGFDACRKIAILTALAYGKFVDFEDILCKGITGISDIDIAYAKALGKKIKLLATARKDQDNVCCEVAPCMIGQSSPLYAVDDVMNAISVRGNMLGEVMFYGAGAGSLPTASAVVADIIVAAKHLNVNVPVKMDAEKLQLADAGDFTDRYFIRLDSAFDADEIRKFAEIECRIDLPDMTGEYGVMVAPISGNDINLGLSRVSDPAKVKNVIKVR